MWKARVVLLADGRLPTSYHERLIHMPGALRLRFFMFPRTLRDMLGSVSLCIELYGDIQTQGDTSAGARH